MRYLGYYEKIWLAVTIKQKFLFTSKIIITFKYVQIMNMM